jgi:hypothetical protein
MALVRGRGGVKRSTGARVCVKARGAGRSAAWELGAAAQGSD